MEAELRIWYYHVPRKLTTNYESGITMYYETNIFCVTEADDKIRIWYYHVNMKLLLVWCLEGDMTMMSI